MNRRTVLKIHQALSRAYGPLPRMSRGDPLGQLVETILSQNTTDKNSHRAYLNLRRKYSSVARTSHLQSRKASVFRMRDSIPLQI
jgi:endonuclease-3